MRQKILIVGAGPAGLSMARLLKRAGIAFELIEKQSAPSLGGAGIALPANAMKALRFLGLGDSIENEAHRVKEIIYAKPSGQILSSASLEEAPLNLDSFVALHRFQLQKLLLKDLENEIHFNTTVKACYETDSGVNVQFNNNKTEEYRAVIAADGVHSGVRKLLFKDLKLNDLSVTNWRWTMRYPTDNLQPTYMLGKQDAFMAYPISPHTVYCYAHVYDPRHQLYLSSDGASFLRRHFKDYSGIAEVLLTQLTPETKIILGRLLSMPYPIFAKNKVAFIGDASSACSPVLQQGVASALEDAIVLSELLQHFSIKDAFQYYEQYRKKRVTWIMEASDNPIKLLSNSNSSLEFFARNSFIKLNGPLNVNGWKELLKEDPIAELHQYIENLKNESVSLTLN